MRYFTQVEISFEVPDHVGDPKYAGDAPIDYANRALEELRPALEAMIHGGGATGYFITGPKRCECIALPHHGPGHGDDCRVADPRAAAKPRGALRVIHLSPPDAEPDGHQDAFERGDGDSPGDDGAEV